MLKIDRQKKQFSSLEETTLANASLTERNDLQEYICNSPNAFFKEIGQELFVIAKEVQPSDDVQDRIDILALDKEGKAVVIELKRGNNKLQMFQAISYAGMVANWEPIEFLDDLTPERKVKLQDEFLEVDIEEINRHQRLILVAEQFDYSVLVGAEWLNEKYNVNIICCRISLAKDTTTGTEFLVCSNIFPAPELVDQARSRGNKRTAMSGRWPDWNTALADVANTAVVAYFNKEIEARRENYLRKRDLHYRDKDNKRRWWCGARPGYAFVSQNARFEGDDVFWRAGLSQPDHLKPVVDGHCLRFHLYTEQDFQFFNQAVTQQLVGKKWTTTYEDRAKPGDGDGDVER
jgi:hypothetical protein